MVYKVNSVSRDNPVANMGIVESYLFKYELPLLAVHISLMAFLVWQRYKKHKFDSAFFTLFIAQGCARYLGYSAVGGVPECHNGSRLVLFFS